MPKILFGLANQNVDPSEYRDGMAASVRDCYRIDYGIEEHFRKRPGLTPFVSDLPGAVQGCYKTFGGKVLCVSGGKVFELTVNGSKIQYEGNALNASNTCVFTEDVEHVFIAHGGKIAKVDTTAKRVSLLGGNAPLGVTHITYSKGFLLCNGLISGGVAGDTNYSDDKANGYEGAASWEVFNNERLPDGCNALIGAWDAEVYAFGPDSVEVSYNDGVTPWAVLQGAYMQYGLIAPYSVAIADNSLFWLTEADGARHVVRMQNRQPVVVSGPYDRLINSLGTVSDARAWLHQIGGFSFYAIAFPSADLTLAYKLADGTWSEFTYYNPSTASYERYLGTNAIYVEPWNKTLIGDRNTGIIYEQSGNSDNGDAIRCELTSGNNEFGTMQTKIERMLRFRVKKGYAEGGSFQYRVRDNNGPWRNEKSLSLGSLGDTELYIKRPSGGVFRSRQYQIIHSDTATDFIFMGLESEAEGTGR